MTHTIYKLFLSNIIFIGLFSISGHLQAAFYDSAIGKKPSSLLNGRLTIQAPSTSRRDELTIDLQSEKNLFKDQTVLKYLKNNKQLRIVATELFTWRTGNLQGNLVKLIYNYPQKVGLQYKISQIDRNHYELIPSKLLLIRGSALVRTLFFVNTDNTIQSIDIYMNANAILNSKKAKLLAKKLLSSIKAGKRKLRRGPKTVFLGSKQKPHFFKIRLPKGFVISSKKQNHARVYIIRKLVPLGNSQTSLAIYIGSKPSPYHSHFGDYDTSHNAASSRLLGQSIYWHKLKKADSLKRRMAKASQELPWSDKNARGQKYFIHVFADSASNKGMKKMVRLAAKLRYVKKPRYAFINTQNQYKHNQAGNRGRRSSRPASPSNPDNDGHNSSSHQQFFDDETYQDKNSQQRRYSNAPSKQRNNRRYSVPNKQANDSRYSSTPNNQSNLNQPRYNDAPSPRATNPWSRSNKPYRRPNQYNPDNYPNNYTDNSGQYDDGYTNDRYYQDNHSHNGQYQDQHHSHSFSNEF